MSQASTEQFQQALASIQDIYLDQDLVSAGIAKQIAVNDGVASVQLVFPYAAGSYADIVAAEVKALAVPGVNSIEVQHGVRVESHAVQRNLSPLPGVKNIIAIASGKGGVGKSTVAANFALALAANGVRTALLDADIYGPSQPTMMGIEDAKPEPLPEQKIKPVPAYGLQTMSIGYMVDVNEPTIWRGPMVTQALQQMLFHTVWEDVDYLVLDLPPGTGDIQLTLAQKIPVSGAVVVTTPQDIAMIDARKGLCMFEKVSVNILGVVENMATHVCSNCGHEEDIFGKDGGGKLAVEADVELLGQIPLAAKVRLEADAGKPTVVADPESNITERYVDIARRATALLSQQAKDYSGKFPKIVIE